MVGNSSLHMERLGDSLQNYAGKPASGSGAGSSCTSPWQLMRCRLYLFFCEKNDQTRSQWHFCNCGGGLRRPMTFQTIWEFYIKKTSHVSTSWNLSGTYRYERFLTKIFFELKITKMWVKAKYVTKNNRLYTMSEADHKIAVKNVVNPFFKTVIFIWLKMTIYTIF